MSPNLRQRIWQGASLVLVLGLVIGCSLDVLRVSRHADPRRRWLAQTPDWVMKATLYHGAQPGMSDRDRMGCLTVPHRTAAVDPRLAPLGTRLFIKETMGLKLPGNDRKRAKHDGIWYASDTGRLIKGARIDLYVGDSANDLLAFEHLNLQRLSIVRAGKFDGCPAANAPLDRRAPRG